MFKFLKISDFYETIRLSILAARVCYSNSKIDELIEEANSDKYFELLSKLKQKRHFSVFAHSFVYKDCYSAVAAQQIAADYFKSVYVQPTIIGLSLRHFLENSEKNILEDINKEKCKKLEILEKYKIDDQELALLYRNKQYGGWMVIFIDGISRVTSHQIVRHTSLNFNMNSQRYTNVLKRNCFMPDLSYLEDKIKIEKIKNIFLDKYNEMKQTYSKLLILEVKKEDARYILPEATTTSLIISGHDKAWQNFLDLRLPKTAQKEIRNIASKIVNWFIK
jgi:thymidylate synthase (FAD)